MWETGVALIIVGAMAIFVFIASNLKKNDLALQLFFFAIFFFLALAGITISRHIAQFYEAGDNVFNAIDAVYVGMIWIAVFIVAYLFMFWIIGLIKALRSEKAKEDLIFFSEVKE